MNLEKIRQDCLPIFVKLLQTELLDWNLVEKVAEQAGYSCGLVRLAYHDRLSHVLKDFSSHWVQMVKDHVSRENLECLRTHEKIRKILEISFITLEEHKSALRTIVTKNMMMRYGATEMRELYQIMNQLWYYVGDQSTDYNFYTKRILLSWVYVPVFLFWVKENSSLEDTMDLLDRRLAQVSQIPKWKARFLKDVDFFSRKRESNLYESRL